MLKPYLLALSVAVGFNLYVAPANAVFRPPVFFHHLDGSLNAELHGDSGIMRISSSNAAAVPKVYPENVTLPLDHFGNCATTFQNRYWVLEEFYEPGNPVFLYDAGEANAEPAAESRLANNASFFRQLVREFKGMGIVWEHRYYGTSTPFNISTKTPAEEMQWLTTAQALADLPAFANNFSRPNFPLEDLTPDSTPWVFVGGSYPGMRAAFVRSKYPETFLASFSSSAPVQAQTDMSIYFEQVYRGMNAAGFGNCTKDIHAALEYIDEQLADPTSSAALKRQFVGRGGEGSSNEGFADGLTYIYWGWQGFGVEGTPGGPDSIREFCDWIATDPGTNKLSDADGWAPKKTAKWVTDRWASWPKMIEVINTNTPTNCSGPQSNTTSTTCNLDLPFPDPSSVSWTWQYCTEWGFFQSANLGPTNIVSKFNSLEHQQQLCYRQFPDGLASGFLPKSPEVERMNREYGGWKIRPSNVFFSGGEFDPWRTLSTLSTELFAPKNISITQDIPKCNVPTNQDTIFGYLLKNAEHCFDFKTSWKDGANSRAVFKNALKTWLGCFEKRTRV